jgi:hypothetical protein
MDFLCISFISCASLQNISTEIWPYFLNLIPIRDMNIFTKIYLKYSEPFQKARTLIRYVIGFKIKSFFTSAQQVLSNSV